MEQNTDQNINQNINQDVNQNPNTSKFTDENPPKTIEELKQWYKDMNLPPEDVTRFYIGGDYYPYARAFGIYKDEFTGNFVVYKNKGDGERAVRYNGPDEAYAVNELWMKLKDEIAVRKGMPTQADVKKSNLIGRMILILFIVIFVFFAIKSCGNRRPSGYYEYNNRLLYSMGDDMYYYDDYYDDWYYADFLDDGFYDYYDDYRAGDDAYYYYGAYDFEDTYYYDDYHSSSSSSSSNDYSWSSDSSWDSGSTDWGSDW